METIAHLVIQVSTSQVAHAQTELSKLGFQAKQTENSMGGISRASDGLMAKLASLAAGLGLTTLAYQGMMKLFRTSKEFESLEAQLKTATGSAEDAVIAFEAITDFATKTPFDLQQATGAFIRLVNLGLDPSERAMTSYGDTASALGRSMEDMVNAVAKATTGEFEPLKSFGVKSRKEADGIVFTFKGLSTKVGNTTREIEEYFISLGETQFAGAMAERMKTLEGLTSNLGDAWDQLFYKVGKAGASDLMKDIITKTTAAIQELTAMIVSGELPGYIEAIAIKFRGVGEAASTAINFLVGLWNTGMGDVKKDSDTVMGYITRAFFRLPENIVAVVKGIGATFGVLVEYAIAVGTGVYDAIVGYFKFAWESSKTVAALIWELAKDPRNAAAAMSVALVEGSVAQKQFADTTRRAWDQTTNSIKFATAAYTEVIGGILDTAAATSAEADAAVEGARKKRIEYEKLLVVERMLQEFYGNGDRLAGYNTNSGNEDTRTQAQKDALRDLKIALGDEEAAVELSYQKRMEIIKEGTLKGPEGDGERAEATAMLNNRIAMERSKAADDKMARLYGEYQNEQRALANALQARQITESQFQAKSKDNWVRYENQIGQVANGGALKLKIAHLQMHSDVLSMASSLAGQLETLVQGNNAAAKTMFIVAKGVAIAQAIINTELAATKAMAEGGAYAGIPLSAIIRATGYASVGIMVAQSISDYKGKFAAGGYIPQGGYGLVGETGKPEVVRGPAMITSAQATADHQLAGRGNSGSMTVNIINQSGADVATQERNTPDGKVLDVFIRRFESKLASSVASGGTPLSRAIETAYGVNRAHQR